MIDYPALRAVAMVARTGSFEKAARALNVTPSAVSQRVKQLEERLGAVLIARGNPCTATERGEWLCRHVEQVGMLERELLHELPALAAGEPRRQVTLSIATNADSLGTWFLKAVASFARSSDYLLDIAVDDQDHTAEWLRQGRVLAAVTALARPVQGCRIVPLGVLRYRATAAPDFAARRFPGGVTRQALEAAPSLTFNQKDRLQESWVREYLDGGAAHPPPHPPHCPTHWLPSTHSFVEACLEGMGWGMNPVLLVEEHLKAGRLVELVPETPLDIPLFWQVNRLAADRLAALTRDVVATAARILTQPDHHQFA